MKENSAGRQITCLSHEMRRLMDVNLQRQKLSSVQIRVLGFLDFSRDKGIRCSQTDVRRECLNTRSSSVTSVLQALEREGYITREAGSDARVKYITLTEKGLEVAHTCREFILRMESVLVEDFTDEEKELLYAFISRMKENLKTFYNEIV